MNVDTQTAQILAYLQSGHSISQLHAYYLFQCTRLSSRIFDLRKDGHNIVSKNHYDPNTKKNFAFYSLAEFSDSNSHQSLL